MAVGAVLGPGRVALLLRVGELEPERIGEGEHLAVGLGAVLRILAPGLLDEEGVAVHLSRRHLGNCAPVAVICANQEDFGPSCTIRK